jgi:hypothetical protein
MIPPMKLETLSNQPGQTFYKSATPQDADCQQRTVSGIDGRCTQEVQIEAMRSYAGDENPALTRHRRNWMGYARSSTK